MNVDLVVNVRTRASATLQRNVSLPGIHTRLIGMFVDRHKLQDEIQENIKPQFDVSVFTTREYLKKEYCYTTFTEPQCKDYYETQFGFDENDLMFIKDGGVHDE